MKQMKLYLIGPKEEHALGGKDDLVFGQEKTH